MRFFLIFYLFFYANHLVANKTLIDTFDDKKLKINIPKGYCDISFTPQGQQLIKSDSEAAVFADWAYVRIVFATCVNGSPDGNLPWGTIGIEKIKNSYKNQKHLNKEIMKKLTPSGDFFEHFMRGFKKLKDKSITKINIEEISPPVILWSEDDTFIYSNRIKRKIENNFFTENLTQSITYFKGYLVHLRLYEKDYESVAGRNIKVFRDFSDSIGSFEDYAVDLIKEKFINDKEKNNILESATYENKIALLIANQDYKNKALSNPKNDIILIADTLEKKGFTVLKAKNLNYKKFREALESFRDILEKTSKDTTILIYYAGHGLQYEGNNFLVPIGANIKNSLDIEVETINLQRIFSSIHNSNGVKIVLLDACRNNPYKGFSRNLQRGLSQINTPTGVIIGYSTAPGKVAEDGSGEYSPYASSLVQAINESGLSIEQVLKRTRVLVMEKTNNEQIPWDSSSLTKEFYFTDR